MSFITSFSSWAYTGRPPSFGWRLFWYLFLWPISQFYKLALRLRHYRPQKLPIKVISVGSITVGGAGKSPVAAFLADYWQNQGQKVAILSRGYKRKSRELVVVSDGHGYINEQVAETGDEPLMLARQLAGQVIVISYHNRYLAGLKAIELGATAAILDDGAQHRQLFRDVDFILLDPAHPLGNGCFLPAGPLRDLPKRINGGIVWWHRGTADITAGENKDKQSLKKKIYDQSFDKKTQSGSKEKPLAEINSYAKISRILTAGDKREVNIAGQKVAAFCGLARPQNFFTALERLQPAAVEPLVFADHHAYTPDEIAAICARAQQAGCQYAVTTEKDLVKIAAQWWPGKLPLCYAPLELQLDEGSQQCLKTLLC